MKLNELRAMLDSLANLPDEADVFFRLSHGYTTINLVVAWKGSDGNSEIHLILPRKTQRQKRTETK